MKHREAIENQLTSMCCTNCRMCIHITVVKNCTKSLLLTSTLFRIFVPQGNRRHHSRSTAYKHGPAHTQLQDLLLSLRSCQFQDDALGVICVANTRLLRRVSHCLSCTRLLWRLAKVLGQAARRICQPLLLLADKTLELV